MMNMFGNQNLLVLTEEMMKSDDEGGCDGGQSNQLTAPAVKSSLRTAHSRGLTDMTNGLFVGMHLFLLFHTIK